MSTAVHPLEIRRLESGGLSVRWSDGQSQSLTSDVLRKNCPCATCREERGEGSHDKPISPSGGKKSLLKIVEHTAEQSTNLTKIWAIGNYAIGIEWGDRHSSGIYTYDLLRSL